MTPLGLVNLLLLMKLSAGRSDIAVGLIDGPVVVSHADLTANIREAPGAAAACARSTSAACSDVLGERKPGGEGCAGLPGVNSHYRTAASHPLFTMLRL
jgi:hypothetical protein